jgi:Fur family peroxide stress response transcriptional regulator
MSAMKDWGFRMRQTRQRCALLRALQQTDQHPTAEILWETVRQDVPNISLGTVYRLLHQLVDEGTVGALRIGTGATRYDLHASPHHHIACVCCGHVMDVPALLPPDMQGTMQTELERWTGYQVLDVRLAWQGRCPHCTGGKTKE